MSKKPSLKVQSIIIDGKYYRVEDWPIEEIEKKNYDVLKKGIAYHIKTDITNAVYPFLGDTDSLEYVRAPDCPVGIYKVKVHRDVYRIAISRPKTKTDKLMYNIDNVKNIASAVMNGEYSPDQFADLDINMSGGGESFLPPLHSDDDIMNRIVKVGIRLKDTSFEPYGKRLEATAAIKKKKSNEAINLRNNAKRGIIKNRAMSSTKAMQYTEAFDMRFAIILQDVPGAPNPMFNSGSSLIIYSTGNPFDIDYNKLITVQEVLEGEGGTGIATEDDVIDDEEELEYDD